MNELRVIDGCAAYRKLLWVKQEKQIPRRFVVLYIVGCCDWWRSL